MTKKRTKNDENTLSGRIGRYAKVTTSMSALAARLAGQKYLGKEIDREKHAKQLTEALGDLKGPLLKVAQLLATIPEALPREYAAELQQLQSNAPSMGWPFVKRRMSAELGKDWQSKFKQFDKQATAAASLGQVHKAETHDGKTIACKLQYPDMGSAVEADLNQLKLILGVFEKYDKAISTKYIHSEIKDRLREELDYRLEAQYTQLYAHLLKDEKGVQVPELISELSTDRLISTTWLDGDKILNFVDDKISVRNKIALNMFRAWYVPLYGCGVIHGDPHLGNYTINKKDYSVNLLDFGCVRIFPPSFVEGVINLYHALCHDDLDLAVHAYKSWGFKKVNNELIEILNVWASFLYGPIMENKKRPIGVVTEGIYGRETAAKVHAELRRVGGITIPREFVFMDRAALGLGSVFLHLKAELNWYKMFNELIEDFDVKKLAKNQKAQLKRFHLEVQA